MCGVLRERDSKRRLGTGVKNVFSTHRNMSEDAQGRGLLCANRAHWCVFARSSRPRRYLHRFLRAPQRTSGASSGKCVTTHTGAVSTRSDGTPVRTVRVEPACLPYLSAARSGGTAWSPFAEGPFFNFRVLETTQHELGLKKRNGEIGGVPYPSRSTHGQNHCEVKGKVKRGPNS